MIDIPAPIVLASSSPTRAELLSGLAADFEVVEPHIDERAVRDDAPEGLALKLATAKARQVAQKRPDALVIGADTLVVCRGRVVGKPLDREDAVRILEDLTRNAHKVLTALHVIAPGGRERSCCVESVVRMRQMQREEIEEYLNRPGVLDKAGAYELQPDDPNVAEIAGSVTAVMGLPLEELQRLICELYPDRGRGE
ncbi:MAG: septum formation protein Maf [Candidatus Brocadiae bacterium]|nr:septum formation protein Maf [Candidatus Brocadiia bacterium]